MIQSPCFFNDLSDADVAEILARSVTKHYRENDLIFAEGDQVDSFYIVRTGRVSIFFNKCGNVEEVCRLGPGEYFGEMAIFNQDKRSASVTALDDVSLLSIDKDVFLSFINSHPHLADKINTLLTTRNEELVLRECLVDTTGVHGKKLHISIKGDPSLRESAFFRGRYESVVDKILPSLEFQLEDLLLNRSVYRIFIGFNSGEIRTSSVFDPYNEEVHTADRLIDKAYVKRHFPVITYTEKTQMIRSMYQFISAGPQFNQLPMHWKNIFTKTRHSWRPINRKDISNVMTRLTDLRSIPNFYLRNFSISMIQDAIRMQFNCDGTHIVSTEDYQRFLEENVAI